MKWKTIMKWRRINLVLGLVLVLSVFGCFEGTTGVDDEEVNSTDVGTEVDFKDEDLKNYTNADWLYETYFGEYEVSKGVNDYLMHEMKMMANGVALAYAKGEDYITEMSYLDFVARNISESMPESAEIEFEYTESVDDYMLSYDDEDSLTENVKEGIEKINSLVQEELKKQCEDVENFDLPYKVDYLAKIKYPSSYFKTYSGGSSKSINYARSGAETRNFLLGTGRFAVDGFGEIRDASVLYSRCGFIGSITGHVGLVRRIPNTFGTYGVIESIEQGVVETTGWRWVMQRTNMILLDPNIPDDPRFKAVNFARSKIGLKYNACVWDYETTSKYYCSQLVYQAFCRANYCLGVGPGWFAVTPEHISNTLLRIRFLR